MAFNLDRGGVLRVGELDEWPWLVHGFGTRSARPRAPAGMKLLTLGQIHSAIVRLAGGGAPAGLRGDALLTRRPGRLLGIKTADCFPVLLVDGRRRAVAAVHAGWRGLVQRVVEKTAGEMRRNFGSAPADLRAAIGPGIQACCFEVGHEVLEEFASQFADAGDYCRLDPPDPLETRLPQQPLTGVRNMLRDPVTARAHVDLAEAVRRQLLAAGLDLRRIYNSGRCTACELLRFYSYRREKDAAGRMLSVIGIRR